MNINVVVPDKTVVIDGEGRFCPDLIAPHDWAHAYSWDGEQGRIEPVPIGPFHEVEWFSDIAVMQPFIDVWEANAPHPPEATP